MQLDTKDMEEFFKPVLAAALQAFGNAVEEEAQVIRTAIEQLSEKGTNTLLGTSEHKIEG